MLDDNGRMFYFGVHHLRAYRTLDGSTVEVTLSEGRAQIRVPHGVWCAANLPLDLNAVRQRIEGAASADAAIGALCAAPGAG